MLKWLHRLQSKRRFEKTYLKEVSPERREKYKEAVRQQRAQELLDSDVSFGRITTAEAPSVDYSQFKNKRRTV